MGACGRVSVRIDSGLPVCQEETGPDLGIPEKAPLVAAAQSSIRLIGGKRYNFPLCRLEGDELPGRGERGRRLLPRRFRV